MNNPKLNLINNYITMNSFQNYGSYHPVNNSNGDPTHEYIDCELINNSTTDLSPIPVIFNNVKTRQIIDDCSNYYLSVVRWSLDCGLPQIIPQMALSSVGGTNIDQTAYNINIAVTKGSEGNSIFHYPIDFKYVNFEPENFTVTVPTTQPSKPDQVYNNPYYYIHSIGHFLNMVNTTINNLLEDLVTYASSSNTLELTVLDLPTAPIHFDWNGSVISANLPTGWIYGKDKTFNFYITMNTPLHNLFDTFPYRFLDSSLDAADEGRNFCFMFYDHQWDSTYSEGTTPLIDYFVFNQEGSSVPSWSPVNSIVFQTSTIPVNPTHTGAPVYAGKNLKDSIQASGISNVLTDFEIPLDRGDEYTNALIYYTPNSEYRLFDINSNGSLKDLNIQIYWKDKLGFIHQFLMKNGASCSLKLLLRKKSFNGI
jgi:hypothetical protein